VARWCRRGLTGADPFGCRCLTSHPLLRLHLPLIEPDRRISRIRLSDRIQAAAHGPARRPRLRRRPKPLPRCPSRETEVLGNMAILLTLTASAALLKSGPFPPPALPGFDGTAGLSATPHGPACPSRASGWSDGPPLGLPVLRPISLCTHAVAITPVGPQPGTSLPCCCDGGLPHPFAGSAPTFAVSRPARRSLHVTACVLAESPTRSFPSEAPAVSLPPPPLRLLPAGAKVAGQELHLLKIGAFARRTKGSGVDSK